MRQRSKSFTANTSYHDEEDYDNNHDESASASEAEETIHSGDDFHIPKQNLIGELIEKVLSVLPVNDEDAYSERLEKINWEEVTVGGLSIEQSQALLERFINPIMKIRTLAEVLLAAKKLLSDISKHPDRPKRPIPAYQTFIRDKWSSLKEKHPKWSQQQLLSRMAVKWSGLSEEKKAKYYTEAEENKRLYKKQIRAFEEEHPELAKKIKLPKSLNADTALAIYYQDRTKQSERRLTLNQIRQEWKELPFSQKLLYIRQQVEKMGSGLNTEDLKAYRKEAGLPEKPRLSYHFFLRNYVRKHPELNFKDMNKETSKEWKRLSQDKREKWKRKYSKALEKYKDKYKEFQQSASDELKTLLQLKEDKDNTPKPPKPINIKGILKKYNAPTKPISAYFIFMEDFKEKHPNLGFQERRKATGEAWKSLSDEQRTRYEKKYQRAMKEHEAEWAVFEAKAPPEVLSLVRKKRRTTSTSSEDGQQPVKRRRKENTSSCATDASSSISAEKKLEKKRSMKVEEPEIEPPKKPPKDIFEFYTEKYHEGNKKVAKKTWKSLSEGKKKQILDKYDRAKEKFIT